MRARALDVRDVMKLMGVLNFAGAPGCEVPNVLLFSLQAYALDNQVLRYQFICNIPWATLY